MPNFPIVVIGASSGGIEAVRTVLSRLSNSLPAAVAAVIHIGSHSAVRLPDAFLRWSVLPVSYATDGEAFRPGAVYLAPPDRHLLVDDGRTSLSHGPRENFTRPAVDPLFRTAAEFFGPLTIGIVLSGNLSDGTAGLWEIKRRGGIAIVQDPREAEYPGMPHSASEHVEVDYCVSVNDIGALVSKLAVELAAKKPHQRQSAGEETMSYSTDKPVALICPDCGGAMREKQSGRFIRYQCHIGHAFGRDDVAAAQLDWLERTFGASLRLLKERVDLCRNAADSARAAERQNETDAWDKAAEEAESRIQLVTDLLEAGWQRPELEHRGGEGWPRQTN